MRRAQLLFVVGFAGLVGLLAGCGDGGRATLPAAPVHNVPPGVSYYVVGQATLLPPDPLQDGTYPIACDGSAIPPGTVLPFQATDLEGTLEFQAGAGSFCGDPTKVTLYATGTDEPRLEGFFLQLAGLDTALLPDAPYTMPQPWSASFNINITCDQAAQNGIPVTLYVTEDRSVVPPRYGGNDEVVLTSYQLEVYDAVNGLKQFVPGSPIEGTFSFQAQAGIQLGGPVLKARMLVEGCFRLPATCPIHAFPGSAATCP